LSATAEDLRPDGQVSEGYLLDQTEAGIGTSGDPIVDEAKKRFQRCSEWEAPSRDRFIDDLKFSYGDADNGYQWPNAIRRTRDIDSKPCLTMNIIRQHNLQIINDAKRNKSEITVLATGGGATADSAEIHRAILSDIQYSSQAQLAYSIAREFQVYGGIGYWRIVTKYVDENTFDQEVVIEPIIDPLSVYIDPDIKQRNGSDAKFAFVFNDIRKESFREAYPHFISIIGRNPLGIGSGDDDWITRDHVRVCEYFRKVYKEDRLISFIDPSDGQRRNLKESRMPKEMIKPVLDDELTKTRKVWEEVVEWYLIAGDQAVDSTIWPGKYIPLIRVVGEEQVVEGILDRKGHTRAMKDAQRMYNYNASAQVEVVALQTKTPWKGAAAAIEEYENFWNNANTTNNSFLPFNHIDDDGNPIPPEALPARLDPPAPSQAFEMGMQAAFNQIMMVSGQYQNQQGAMGNERTGTAIQERMDQGDTSTYHFRDNYENALVYTGMQIIDLIPKIYDTARIMMIQADDGSMYELAVDPKQTQALMTKRDITGAIIRRIFNPSVGRYEVRAAPGQAFGTRRQETVQALTLILTQAPALTGVIGDLLLSAMDFKEAKEAAQRLRRMVPPQALGEGPSQQEQNLMSHNLALTNSLRQALQRLGKEQLKLSGKDQMRDIDVYKAETDRMKALQDIMGQVDPEGARSMIEDLVREAAHTHLVPILEANRQTILDDHEDAHEGEENPPSAPVGDSEFDKAAAPIPGALRGGDGEWYLSDPTRRGKYMRIAPLAQERQPGNIVQGM
jgi:Phage P22-like portal protein